MQKILIIQTAFIGDVVLATGIAEKLHSYFPDALIDILVRKGNESLFIQHPFIHEVLTWDKKKNKYQHLLSILKKIRQNKYDRLINVQRFAATGFLAAFSGAKQTIGFDKNPFSFLFSDIIRHDVNKGDHAMHEIERNHQLISSFTDNKTARPKLYPSADHMNTVAKYKTQHYVCIAPASVWFTKQFPADQWIELIDRFPKETTVYLLGAPGDQDLCKKICEMSVHSSVRDLSGKLSFLESAALQKDAVMNYVNDSAPMHFASSVNAAVTAVYCSTIPAFGFGPLSDNSHVVELIPTLPCRPCGLHGRKVCPLGHFNCAKLITTEQLLGVLPK
jgi:heptosyltransferase-2